MLRSFAVLLLANLVASAAPAQEPALQAPPALEDDLLDRLEGEWTMQGTLLGDSITYDVTGAWVLGHQFLVLDMVEVSDPTEYEAAIYIGFDPTIEQYVVHWLDDFGGGASTLGYGRREGSTLAILFDNPASPFRDTFAYDPDTDRWQVLIEAGTPDGTWAVFSETEMTKK